MKRTRGIKQKKTKHNSYHYHLKAKRDTPSKICLNQSMAIGTDGWGGGVTSMTTGIASMRYTHKYIYFFFVLIRFVWLYPSRNLSKTHRCWRISFTEPSPPSAKRRKGPALPHLPTHEDNRQWKTKKKTHERRMQRKLREQVHGTGRGHLLHKV